MVVQDSTDLYTSLWEVVEIMIYQGTDCRWLKLACDSNFKFTSVFFV